MIKLLRMFIAICIVFAIHSGSALADGFGGFDGSGYWGGGYDCGDSWGGGGGDGGGFDCGGNWGDHKDGDDHDCNHNHVPEPGTMFLLVIGLVGLAGAGRKIKN